MEHELNPKVISFSLASVSGALSLICAFLMAIAPKAAFKFFGSIFHGADLTKIASPVTIPGVITGLVAIVIISFVSGWLFAVIYNYFLSKAK